MTRTCNCFADENTPGYEGHLPTCNLHYPSGCSGIMPDEDDPAPAPDAPAAREECEAWRKVAAAWLIQAYGSGHGVAADLVEWADKTLAGEPPWHVERTRAAISGKEFK